MFCPSDEYYLGRQYARQQVIVWLDAQAHQWIIETSDGAIIKWGNPKKLNYRTIATMALTG